MMEGIVIFAGIKLKYEVSLETDIKRISNSSLSFLHYHSLSGCLAMFLNICSHRTRDSHRRTRDRVLAKQIYTGEYARN